MNRIEQMQKVQTEGLELFKKKNADYGDAFADYGVSRCISKNVR